MKRIISVLLVASILFGLVGGLSGCSRNNTVLSRSEWIEQLSAEFGLDQYMNTEQAFTDVDSEEVIFANVQSCVEWGVLDNSASKEFKPQENAQVSFAVETAVAAAGVDLDGRSVEEFARDEGIVSKAFLDYNGNLTPEKANDIIDWAKGLYINREQKPVENVVLQNSVKDISDATTVAQVSESAYTVTGTDVDTVKKDDVIILPPSDQYPSGLARKVVSVKRNADGSVTYETVEPSIEEVCADLEIATTVVPEKEDIILAEGVSWGVSDTAMGSLDGAKLVPLIDTSGDAKVVQTASKGLDFTLSVNFTKGKLSLSENFANLFKTTLDDTGLIKGSKEFNSLFGMGEKVTVGGEMGFSAQSGLDDTSKLGELFNKTSIIPDKNLFGKDPYDNTAAIEAYKAGEMSLDELKKELDLTADQQEKEVASMTNKFKGSYEITGSLSIKNLYVEPEIKLEKVLGVPTGIEKLSVEVNYDIESTLKIKGKITEELVVCSCPVAVGATGVTINVQLILFADFNGELGVKAVISNNTKMEYSGGKFKRTAAKSSSLSADLSAQIDFGPGFKIDVLFLGLNIIDTKVTAAVRLKFNAGLSLKTSYAVDEEAITINRCTDYTLKFSGYVPIVTLSIGQSKSFANKLKLTFSWEIIGEKSALKFDIGQENATLWKEELIIKLREEEVPDETTPDDTTGENEKTFDPSDYLQLEEYYLRLDENDQTKIKIEHIPEGYSESDLIWSIENPEIAAVNGGVVTGMGYGTTIAAVKTSDGIYACYIAINVGSEVVEFTPLEDSLIYDT